jgi:hypothetical protein
MRDAPPGRRPAWRGPVYVEDAGHAIASDQPALYLSLLRAFLLDRPLPLAAWDSADPPR